MLSALARLRPVSSNRLAGRSGVSWLACVVVALFL
jgi:hypothetical protein